jgi:hypothetical protein
LSNPKESLKQLFYQLIDDTSQAMNRLFCEMFHNQMKESDALMPRSEHFLELPAVSQISKLLPGMEREQLKVAKPFIP